MEKLKTTYLGLPISSPLIVSSSSLTSTPDRLKEAEDSGAGAVVLKSLFEEQINYYVNTLSETSSYPEADDYISYYTRSKSVEEYLSLIKTAKESLDIPVIPSINCISSEGWIDFARHIASAGASALEVNVFFLPVNKNETSAEAEKVYFSLIEKLTKTIDIPVVIKMGPRFSNILYMIDQFYRRGAKGVVLFNRFYEPDIDIENMSITPASVFSTEAELRYVIRWIAMSSAMDIKIDISASTGVHSGHDAIKCLLAGADSVQVCSALYNNGIGYIRKMNKQMAEWMDKKGFRHIEDFRGRLNYLNFEKPSVFERTQFMKYFSSHE
jgi:dihydroorotate dehydrogenase (fumarate)